MAWFRKEISIQAPARVDTRLYQKPIITYTARVGPISPRSGGGNGIAPVTPPTPPDMRSSASGG